MGNFFSIAGQIALVAVFAVFLKYVGSGQGKRRRATGLALIVLAAINILTIWHYDVDPLQFTIKCMKGNCPTGSKPQQLELVQRPIRNMTRLDSQQNIDQALNDQSSPLVSSESVKSATPSTEKQSAEFISSKIVTTQAIDDIILEMAVSPSGQKAVVESYDQGSERLSVWDLQTGEQVRALARGKIEFRELGWSANERVVTVLEAMGSSRPQMLAFHLDSGEERNLFSTMTPIGFVARNRDGDVDAIVYESENYPSFIRNGKPDKQITFRPPIWKPYEIDEFGFFVPNRVETRKREMDTQLRANQCAGAGHAYNSADMHLLWIGSGGCMLIWDIKTEKPHRVVENVPLEFTTVSTFSHDGKMFARGSRDGIVEIFSTNNWQKIRQIRAEEDAVSALSFGPEGQKLATAGGFDGVVKVWDVLTGELKQSVEHQKGISINHVTIVASGNRIISGSNEIKSNPLN